MGKGHAAICRMGGIGDDLIASSVLPLLARKYYVDVITETPNHVVFVNNPHVHRLILKEKEDMPHGDAIAWQRWFMDRAKEYNFFINLSHSCENLLAMQFGQTQFHWPQAWRQAHCNKSYLEAVHDICGLPYVFGRMFFPTEKETALALETRRTLSPDRPLVGWVISGSRFDKLYPYAAHAISRVIQECGATVLLFGASNEKDIALARGISDHVLKALGNIDHLHAAIVPPKQDEWALTDPGQRIKQIEQQEPVWPLRRSLTQVQFCDVVVSPDTGLAWAVAMEAMPKVVLLSHASPTNITKHWRNTTTLHADPKRVPCFSCHQLHDSPETCRPNADKTAASCMADITAEQVVSAVKASLTT